MGFMLGKMLRGAVAGAMATWLMDLVTTGMLTAQSEEVTQRENAAQPDGKTSVANLVGRLDALLGLDLDEQGEGRAASGIHYGLGVVPGALYSMLRGHGSISVGRGAIYGLLLWLVNDEWLNARLRLSAPMGAYPIQTHMRGAAGHVVLGVATEVGIGILGG